MDTLYIQCAGLPSRTPLTAILEGLDPLDGLMGVGLTRDEALELIYVHALRLEGAQHWAAMLNPRVRKLLSVNARESQLEHMDALLPQRTECDAVS